MKGVCLDSGRIMSQICLSHQVLDVTTWLQWATTCLHWVIMCLYWFCMSTAQCVHVCNIMFEHFGCSSVFPCFVDITFTCNIPGHPGHPTSGWAMATKKVIKGSLKNGAFIGKDNCNKAITNKGKAKDPKRHTPCTPQAEWSGTGVAPGHGVGPPDQYTSPFLYCCPFP